MGYKEILTTNTTTYIPSDLPEGNISVLIFYPGPEIGGKLGKDYMPELIKKGASEWFNKYVIVIPNTQTKNWQNVKDEYESELNVRKLKVANINIGIYSTSGQNNSDITKQLKNISSLSNVMLMDPNSESVLEDTIKELRTSKEIPIYMMYNTNNWITKPDVLDSLKRLSNYVGTANVVDTNSLDYDHDTLPINFLETLKGLIQ